MGTALTGFGLGFLVALQVGPMSLFLMRCTLRGGWRAGVAVGAAIALVDGAYAACGAAGVTPLLAVEPVRLALGLIGAVLLIGLGVRTLHGAFLIRSGLETPAEAYRPRRAFLAGLAGTASNPATIISWAAIFAAANAGGAATRSPAGEVLLVLGVTLGSLTWVLALASGLAAVRARIGTRALRVADGLAGVGLLGFGGALGVSALHER